MRTFRILFRCKPYQRMFQSSTRTCAVWGQRRTSTVWGQLAAAAIFFFARQWFCCGHEATSPTAFVTPCHSTQQLLCPPQHWSPNGALSRIWVLPPPTPSLLQRRPKICRPAPHRSFAPLHSQGEFSSAAPPTPPLPLHMRREHNILVT
jgi:hypothetical protein